MCVLSQGSSSAVFKYLLFLNLEEGIYNFKSAAFETAYDIQYSISTILLRTMSMTGESSKRMYLMLWKGIQMHPKTAQATGSKISDFK